MSNCIKSRKDKCPLKDNCFGLVDDSDDCKCRLEDYQQGRAEERERVIKELEEKLSEKKYQPNDEFKRGCKFAFEKAIEIARGGENE